MTKRNERLTSRTATMRDIRDAKIRIIIDGFSRTAARQAKADAIAREVIEKAYEAVWWAKPDYLDPRFTKKRSNAALLAAIDRLLEGRS